MGQTTRRSLLEPKQATVESVGEIKESLAQGKNGSVYDKYPNYLEIVRRDPSMAGKIRYNALSDDPMLCGVDWNLGSHPLTDYDLLRLLEITAVRYGIESKKKLLDAVMQVAGENAYHPVRDRLNSLEWDGKSRISELFPVFLGVERSALTTHITTVLLHGAIQRVMAPGVKFDLCIILADRQQGTGKSTICRMLALSDDWYCGLNSINDRKAAYEIIRGHWIVELGELLATKHAKAIESIKDYISAREDDYRDPYAVRGLRRPRQCIFIGTTNQTEFLPDDKTGNRRFIPLLCDGRRAERHILDDAKFSRHYIEQCYAEAMEIGRTTGWQLTIDPKFNEELEQLRSESTPEDSRVGMIQQWLDDTKANVVCTRMIWDKVFNTTDGREPKRQELRDISDILNNQINGWKSYKGKDGKAKDNKYVFKEVGSNGVAYGKQRAWIRDMLPEQVVIPNVIPNTGEPSPPDATFAAVSADDPTPFD